MTQIKSKNRVVDHAEVFTAEREVIAMLDLVKQETERIDSRFLEPACGTGNFLVEVLKRKLFVVETKYKKQQQDFERYAVIAISSIYGIDLLEDNVLECRKRLLDIFNRAYRSLFKGKTRCECIDSVSYILSKNIVQGDALTFQNNNKPIIFPEWAAVNGSLIKRRDFDFCDMVLQSSLADLPLFSDLGENIYIPKPTKEYPLTHFLKLNQNEIS